MISRFKIYKKTFSWWDLSDKTKIPLMMLYRDWKKIILLSIPNFKSKFYPLFKKKQRKIAKIKKRIGIMILNRN